MRINDHSTFFGSSLCHLHLADIDNVASLSSDSIQCINSLKKAAATFVLDSLLSSPGKFCRKSSFYNISTTREKEHNQDLHIFKNLLDQIGRSYAVGIHVSK